jgi:hypothetical protein
MEIFSAIQMNFQVSWVVAPRRLANSCLCLGDTNLPSKCRYSTVQAWIFNKHKSAQCGNTVTAVYFDYFFYSNPCTPLHTLKALIHVNT